MKATRKFGIVTLIVVVAGLLGFTTWAYTPLGPLEAASSAMLSDAIVTVSTSDWIEFQPAQSQAPATGLILYPGGRVDPRAYALLARSVASQGYLAVIVPMPFNLAVFSPDQAKHVVAAHPEIRYWAIGGHSLGGAMAARYVLTYPTHIQGLFLLASYPASSDNLTNEKIKAISIIGSQDGLVSPAQYELSRQLLPGDTRWITLEGGNHAQFGDYGPQPGDNSASLSSDAQKEFTAQALIELLRQLP